MNNHQVIELQDKMEMARYVIHTMEEFLGELDNWDNLVITLSKDNRFILEDIRDTYIAIYEQLISEFEKL